MIRSSWTRSVVTCLCLVMGVSAVLAEDTGSIKGKVAFEGTPPKPKNQPAGADPVCAKMHPKGIDLQPVQVKNGGLADVFVQIKNGLPKGKTWPAPSEPAVIDQKGCEYHPHIVGMMAGQKLKVTNSDPTSHNIQG